MGELGDILREMNVGEIKGPVETRVGFHFVKLTGVNDPVLRPFADVQQKIESALRKHAYVVESERYIRGLWSKGFVKIYDQAALPDR